MINTTTNYQSGDELHFEAALNEHFPFGLAAGVGGYYYQQLTADGGSGDKMAHSGAASPPMGLCSATRSRRETQQVIFSGRWFHEFDVAHRVTGNSVFASLAFPL